MSSHGVSSAPRAPARLSLVVRLTLVELVRHRVAMILFLVLPALLIGIVTLTASPDDRAVQYQLPAFGDDAVLFAPPRDLSLVFVALAASGMLCGFVGLRLLQRQVHAHRRLVLCGMPATTLVLAKTVALLAVAALAAALETVLLRLLFAPASVPWLFTALWLGGACYGAFGLVVGSVIEDELEGVLPVALLITLDAGWLQNPVYYADAQHVGLLHALPAYLPSQIGLSAAFAGAGGAWQALASVGYALVLLVVAAVLWRWRRGLARVSPR